ncbi:MAG: XrtB/PEP-CTERM-associated polysaccharide biosynthesis outer membrane protein EpsL [Pseudomonadota bacterium]
MPIFMRKFLTIMLLFGVLLAVGQTRASQEDTFRPYVSAAIVHDSNLFRFSRDFRQDNTSDTIKRLEAGVNVDYTLGRQQVLVDASVNRHLFQRFDFLDFDGNDGRAVWNWQLGNRWQGDLGYTRNQRLATFTEVQSPVRDVRTQQSAFINAIYKFDPDWRLRAGGNWYDLESGAAARRFLNRKEISGVLGAEYVNEAGNFVGGQVRVIGANFPDRVVGVLDNSYVQTEIQGVADWRYTNLSYFKGRLGYTQRKHDQISSRDFNGLTGRLTYEWSVTAKTLARAEIGREIGSIDNLINTYVVTRAVSTGATWLPTAKTFVKADLAYKQRDYRGDPGLGFTGVREDDIRTLSVSVGYTPMRNVQLALDAVMERRGSTRIFADYSYNMVSASVRVEF